jgi:Immunity protein 27
MQGLPDLKDAWIMRDGKMVAEGDFKAINALLDGLDRVTDRDGGWAILYRHRNTGEFWELTYPQGEMHGGGPRRLRRMDIASPDAWTPRQD